LITDIKEPEIEDKKMYYTAMEKYKRMEELNPNLALLRKKLDLDLI
jgi:hypothetical protein